MNGIGISIYGCLMVCTGGVGQRPVIVQYECMSITWEFIDRSGAGENQWLSDLGENGVWEMIVI